MQLDDLEQVMKIENENFSRPWTETGFFTFLIRQDLIRITNEMGVSRLFLEVRESNERAIHVYEKAGFVKNGLRKNYYEDPVEHAVLMMHETVGKER